MSLPKKCLVDTNVPKTANLATQPDADSDVSDACVLACVEAVEYVIKKRGLIIDAGDEIFNEYRQQLSMKGQPGMGDAFMKWVNDHRYNPEYCDRVAITSNGDSYEEFPTHDDLNDFDRSDRKFVAAANAHVEKPPILQATDSKWWGWKDALAEVGITVQFLCPEYIEAKYTEKMGT
ncbi:hypothetical protein LGV61_03190 [Desulfurispirillum indicum]|uniref:Uncharacterized protein n=1 Tax=Desulfurispirillum indicum (strain ATCC BAA-1389 / DSM 22839 / S5) TaxID=653733 RepID=E6W1F0_DESIS|nr:hypothetical protein [Desulfurispirillum indicum]ADU65406.1 hypothetical protein Selin_0659 [Desulfurispirillum indicum S5]UCZ57298.1 hypothetical protein LGV61_03190 [Desulfurispirillum indicum]